MDVLIAIGHSRFIRGRRDGGAVSVDGVQEWDFNRVVAEKLADELTRRGLTSKILSEYRGTGYNDAMKYVASVCTDLNARIAIELHFNSADSSDANGFEYLSLKGSKKGIILADKFDDAHRVHFPDAKPRDGDGIVEISPGGRGYQFLKYTPCPAVICEPFFGNNPKEWARYWSRIDSLVTSYADAIETFLKKQ